MKIKLFQSCICIRVEIPSAQATGSEVTERQRWSQRERERDRESREAYIHHNVVNRVWVFWNGANFAETRKLEVEGVDKGGGRERGYATRVSACKRDRERGQGAGEIKRYVFSMSLRPFRSDYVYMHIYIYKKLGSIQKSTPLPLDPASATKLWDQTCHFRASYVFLPFQALKLLWPAPNNRFHPITTPISFLPNRIITLPED